jgi:hypothetical protein
MGSRVESRGPRCAHLVNGSCGFAGGRCIDGATNVAKSGSPFFCNFFKSRAKATAAKVRWAKMKRGDKSAKIGKTGKRRRK